MQAIDQFTMGRYMLQILKLGELVNGLSFPSLSHTWVWYPDFPCHEVESLIQTVWIPGFSGDLINLLVCDPGNLVVDSMAEMSHICTSVVEHHRTLRWYHMSATMSQITNNWTFFNSCLRPTTQQTWQWRQNERDGVSNHQPHGCLLNRLFRRSSKKTSKIKKTMKRGIFLYVNLTN